MDSRSRVFESSLELNPAGVPLRCPRPMPAQPVVVWTPARVLGALFSVILSVPRAAMMAPAALRNRRA